MNFGIYVRIILNRRVALVTAMGAAEQGVS